MRNQPPQTISRQWAWTPMRTWRGTSIDDMGLETEVPPQEETEEQRMETEAPGSETEEVDACQKRRIRVRAFRLAPRKIHSDKG